MRGSSELILRWPSGAVFTFDAGALCLELPTTGGVGSHTRYEALRTPEDLARWLGTCRLRLTDVRVADDDLPAARQLRSAIWAAATAATEGRRPPRPSVAMINELAAVAPPVPLLAGNRRVWAMDTTGAQALSAIARDAIDLFGGPFARRIRACASTNCELIFVDLSRPGQRRWCSMRRCGNVAKQRARRR